ncbi:unnamed protein product, partial [Ilex paraguariensis]
KQEADLIFKIGVIEEVDRLESLEENAIWNANPLTGSSRGTLMHCFCEKNSDGQTMLASTLIPQPQSMTHGPLEENVKMSFGRSLWFLYKDPRR